MFKLSSFSSCLNIQTSHAMILGRLETFSPVEV